MASQYCKKTATCKNADWCAIGKDFGENCEWYDEITNFYKIQHMTMDELATLISCVIRTVPCFFATNGKCPIDADGVLVGCDNCVYQWLTQEAK